MHLSLSGKVIWKGNQHININTDIVVVIKEINIDVVKGAGKATYNR